MPMGTSVPELSLGLTVSFYREPLLLGGSLPSFLLSLHFLFWVLESLIPSLRFSWEPLEGGN